MRPILFFIMETKSSNILLGKRGIIFGVVDTSSISWEVAKQCKAEGAHFVLTNTQAAIQLGEITKLSQELGVEVIACDVRNEEDIASLIDQAEQRLGGKLDFILHSVAMSMNLRRHKPYTDVNYNYYHTTLDISAISLHKLLQLCLKKDALAEHASVVALTYIASERFMEGYNDMADAKVLLESVVRNMGAEYGEKKGVRVNAISQSPIATRAEQVFDQVEYFHDFAEQLSPLGRASAKDCALLCVMLFSDYTRKVTMQTIYNDGGFGRTLMTNKFIDFFRERSYQNHKS